MPSKKSGCETAPGMGDLREDCTTLGMHCGGDGAPALDLAFRKEAGDVDDSDGTRADPSAFGEDEAAALEKQIGVALLVPTTRALSLTEAGSDYLSHVSSLSAMRQPRRHSD